MHLLKLRKGPPAESPELHSASAEDAVLSIMLRENESISDIAAIVQAEHFYAFHRQIVYEAICDLYGTGRTADCVTVFELLRERGDIKELGNNPALLLAELWTFEGTKGSYEHYCQIVKNFAIQRALHQAGLEIAAQAKRAGPVMESLEHAEKSVAAISLGTSAGTIKGARQCVRSTFDWLDRRSQKSEADGVLSSLVDLDNRTGGFHDSELTLIAARPSVGKTAFACSLALNVVKRRNPVFFVSLEQSEIELTLRLLCAETGVDGNLARIGKIPSNDMESFTAAGNFIGNLPLFVDDTPAQNMLRIAAQSQRLRQREGIRLIVVDYLQLIAEERQRGENREQQIAGISRRLKLLARQLRIPVVALAQLNRQVENRGEEKPKLSDLRDSGSLEQDADCVLMLWRPEGRESNVVEVLIEKQRNGPTGAIRVIFNRQCQRFENMAAW